MMKNIAIVTAAVVTMAATCAHAQTVYTDKAAFLEAAGSTQTETFGGATPGAFSSVGGVYSGTFDGFSVSGQNNGNFVGIATGPTSGFGPNTPIPASFAGQNYLTWADITGGIISLTVQFNEATTAFGFDWFNTDETDQYNLTLAGGTDFTAPPFTVVDGNTATSGFFGLFSDTPFTTVLITNNFFGGYISDEGMDNFITNGVGSANPGAVPEPGAWAMLLLGFGLAGGAMRYRARSTKVAFEVA